MGEPNDGVVVDSPGIVVLDKADILPLSTNGAAGAAYIHDSFRVIAIEADARNDNDSRRIRMLIQEAAPGAVVFDERRDVGDIENNALRREVTGGRKARVLFISVGVVLLGFRG